MNRMSNLAAIMVIIVAASAFGYSQKSASNDNALPTVTKVDEKTITDIFKPEGKPLLINFWATWCVPCVEEFPLLVALHEEYRGRIDIVTISLDDLAEIKRDVPKFLKEQNATMPAYLLYSKDENKVISSIAKDWAGGLPFSILLTPTGESAYSKQGTLKLESIKPAIESALIIKECGPEETDNR